MRPSNRLARERSPYLLQHAHNPVEWYPWGDEAFERARREDKPVFLSIGYSACHWCHVMERESFEDEATAALLNAHFVSVKLDREERPDIDQVYQLAHQVLTQRAGGWPLSMFLTSDRKPFFGGTYFPDTRKHGMPSFKEILAAIHEAYTQRRDDVTTQAAELTRVVVHVTSARAAEPGPLAVGTLDEAVSRAMQRAERTYGGFGRAPKFPNTMTLDLLLIAAAARGDAAAGEHVARTLDRMARGGIYDQLGGGFARYSTDAKWLVPHFEKMLYDNAQLARLYLDAARLLGDASTAGAAASELTPARCHAVVREVAAYVLREMTDPEHGVFYSAQDADSEGEEGRFFVWTPAQIAQVLGPDDARVVCAYFDVTDAGNFEHGKSALWVPRPLEEVASALGRPADEVAAVVARARAKLFAAREARVHPARDDKSLAAWNAQMIGALADAGATLDEPAWVAAATRALTAWRTLAWQGGRLRHAIKNGEAYGTGFLDDYAAMAGAALDAYEATGDGAQLAFARELLDATLELFRDDSAGDFFYTPADGEQVLGRPKEAHDHAYPGGAGLVADALLRAATLTGVLRYRTAAEGLLGTLAGSAREEALGMATVVRAIDRAARGPVELVVIGDPARADTRALVRAARGVYVPHRALIAVADEDAGRAQGLDAALLRGRTANPDGSPRAFVCRGTVCDAPVSEPGALADTLRAAVRAS